MIKSKIFFPISPNKCFILSDGDIEEGYFNAVEEHIPLINGAIIRNAIDQTYAHQDQIEAMKDAVLYHEQRLIS